MTNGNDFAFNDTATRLREVSDDGIKASAPPLTKREYFAAMAMQGLVSAHDENGNWTGGAEIAKDVAEDSVKLADALITALDK